MEGARATWTDERLDDLAARMDSGFARVDGDIRELRDRFDRLEARLDGRIDGLHRTIIQVGGGMIATQILGFGSLIALHFT
jgi:hypothetical protein